MPGPDKVLLNRPDGSQTSVPAEEVDRFRTLGYKDPSAEGEYARDIAAAEEEHFTSPGQRLLTGAEGLTSGLTVGLIPGFTDEAGDRARYNPGTRIGSEIVGAILPTVVAPESLLGRAAALTPAGALARGSEAIASTLTSTRTAHALVRGAVEGGVFGGAAESVNARLAGDPVTAEAVVAGMGWGALWGGGLGFLATKAGITAEKMAAEKAAVDRGLVPAERWGAFRSAIDDVKKSAATALNDAAEAVKAAAKLEPAESVAARVLAHTEEAEAVQGALFNRIDAKGGFAGTPGAKVLRGELKSIRNQLAAASAKGDYGKYEALATRHGETMKALADLTKVAQPELEPFVLQAAKAGADGINSMKELKAVSESLEKFPATPEGFAAMKPERLEKQAAAIEKFIKSAPPELAGVKDAMGAAIDNMLADAGLKAVSGGPAEKLRGAYEVMRAARSASGAKEAAEVASGGFGTSTAKYVGGRLAAKGAGGGAIQRGVAFRAGATAVGGLLSLKSAVLGKLTESVHLWGPGAAKVAAKAAPRIDPLRTRLDGTEDKASRNRQELMAARAREIREAGPTINDTMYRAIEPLAQEHPELAVAMNKAAVTQFDALASRLPRDPGTAFARMRSLWKPDAVMMEQFARSYEVFQNPVGTATKWLANPRSITAEGARAMKEMNPELWTHLRVEMISRLSEPGMLDRLNYSEQVALGQLLDITIHSTQSPHFIKAQQQMFAERNEPLPMRGQNNSNNPSGVSRSQTPAQRTTDH